MNLICALCEASVLLVQERWRDFWKEGRFGLEGKEVRLLFYMKFSGCKMNKSAEGWHVANWKKCKTYYSGETTLERHPLGGITDSVPFCPEILVLAIQQFYWAIIDRSAKERSCARFESVWWSEFFYRGRLLMPGVKPHFLSCLVTIQTCRA
jgi:hypothetical protein